MSLVGNVALMAFYTVVTGWILYYFFRFAAGATDSLGFVPMITNPGVNVAFLAITVALAFLILSFNLQGGLERVTKIMMVALLALTTALGYSAFHFQPFAEGSAWLDFWDFIVSTNILPLGSLVFALFCCNRFGWGWDSFMLEANAGKGMKVRPWMKPLFQWFVPVVILFIYVYGLVNFPWR